MTDVNFKQYSTKELVAILSRISDESKGDISIIFEKLNIPGELQDVQLDKLKKHLELLKSGNKEDMARFTHELENALQGREKRLVRTAKKGGVTKLETYWWGNELYISHDDLQAASSWSALVSLVSRFTGPAGVIILGALLIGLHALKLIDKGNGVILKKVWVGPVIVTRQ
jgi:hypothetical protein